MTSAADAGPRRPAVGVGVMVTRSETVLLERRAGSHGRGTFGWPGGKLEFGESIFEAGRREVLEETGLHLGRLDFICVSNVFRYGEHYLDIELRSELVHDLTAPPGWEWYPLSALPEPIFEPCRVALRSLSDGKPFHDSVDGVAQ